MTATLADVKAGIQARGYGTDTDTAQTQFVKSALRRLYGTRRWAFLADVDTSVVTTLSLDTYDISFITGLMDVDAVRLHDGPTGAEALLPLDYVPQEELIDRIALEPATGTPEQWTLRGTDVVLWPTPDKEYRLDIEVFGLPPLPAVADDPVIWPEQYLEVVIQYACMEMAKRQRDWQAYNAYKADYQESLLDMVRQRGIVQRQTSGAVARWSGWDQVER